LRGLDRKVWVFLHFSGLLWLLYRRRFTELTLFFAPLMVMIAFNLLGYWPLGGFRVNTFVLAYLMFPAMFALDAAPARPRLLRAAAVAFGSALIVLPSLTLGWSDHTRKYALTFNYEIDALMGKLTELYQLTPQRYAKQQAVVIEDNYTCWSTGYYQRYDDGFKNRWPEISKRLELRCSGRRGERFAMKRMRGRTYFVVVTRNPNLNPSELELVDVLVREVVNQTHTVYLVRGK
jgi:hypothetical protein